MASRMVEAGVPMPVIKEALGHVHLSTTEAYISIGRNSLEKGMRVLDR